MINNIWYIGSRQNKTWMGACKINNHVLRTKYLAIIHVIISNKYGFFCHKNIYKRICTLVKGEKQDHTFK